MLPIWNFALRKPESPTLGAAPCDMEGATGLPVESVSDDRKRKGVMMMKRPFRRSRRPGRLAAVAGTGQASQSVRALPCLLALCVHSLRRSRVLHSELSADAIIAKHSRP